MNIEVYLPGKEEMRDKIDSSHSILTPTNSRDSPMLRLLSLLIIVYRRG